MQTKFPSGGDSEGIDNPAVCLVCGKVLNAGTKQETVEQILSAWILMKPVLEYVGNRLRPSVGPSAASFDNAGECTLHARTCGSGTGVFFLVVKDQVKVHPMLSRFLNSIFVVINFNSGRCCSSTDLMRCCRCLYIWIPMARPPTVSVGEIALCF
jgi:hypothetical protein